MMREVSLVFGAITTCAGTGLVSVAVGAGVYWSMVGTHPFHAPEIMGLLGVIVAVVGVILVEYGRDEL